jgi:hypothetical protein
MSAVVFVQYSAENRWRVEMRPLRVINALRGASCCIPAHVVESTICGHHGASPHVSDEAIVFDLCIHSQHQRAVLSVSVTGSHRHITICRSPRSLLARCSLVADIILDLLIAMLPVRLGTAILDYVRDCGGIVV